MLNIPDEIKALFKNGSAFKNFHVQFPNGENADLNNDDIVSESVSFTESICSAQVFQFGLSERSQIEFECVGVQNIYGMTIECALEISIDLLDDPQQFYRDHMPTGNESFLEPQVCRIDTYHPGLSGVGYRIPYGRFIVESCPRSQGAMKHRKVTAYSIFDQIVDSAGFIQNAVLPIDTIHTSFKDLTAYITGDVTGFETLTKYRDTYMDLVHLFDSSGYAYEIAPVISTDPYETGMGGYRNIYGNGYKLLIQQTGDMTNEQVGIETAEYLDANNYDLTYNPDGTKVFSSNEEALRTMFGYLFQPTMYSEFAGVDYTAAVYRPYPAKTGKFVPLFDESSSGLKMYFTANANMVEIRKSSTPNIWASTNTWTAIDHVQMSGTYSTTYEFENYYDAYDVDTVEIKSTGELTDVFKSAGKASSSSNKEKWTNGTMYTFVNAYKNREIMNGAAELNGKFGRVTRNGNFEFLEITNASPVAMTPAEYSELWWDEYVVEPVGKVKYSYNDPATSTETIAEVSTGTGTSEYDMLNNYILKNLNISAEDLQLLDYASVADYVAALIREKFVPNVGVVSFTPVTLDAIGLPYLEAGDYLEIDDADGGTVGTYILSRTISGIQVLTDSIESKGGEVLGNGS